MIYALLVLLVVVGVVLSVVVFVVVLVLVVGVVGCCWYSFVLLLSVSSRWCCSLFQLSRTLCCRVAICVVKCVVCSARNSSCCSR